MREEFKRDFVEVMLSKGEKSRSFFFFFHIFSRDSQAINYTHYDESRYTSSSCSSVFNLRKRNVETKHLARARKLYRNLFI